MISSDRPSTRRLRRRTRAPDHPDRVPSERLVEITALIQRRCDERDREHRPRLSETPGELGQTLVERERRVRHPADRELAAGAGEPGRPERPRPRGIREERFERCRQRRRVAGLRRAGRSRRRPRSRGRRSPASPRPAARRASPRAGRSRSPPSASCARRRRPARASRASRASRAGRRRRSARARPRAPGSGGSGPSPRIASRRVGQRSCTRANARNRVAWSFCSIRRPIASTSGAPVGDAGLVRRDLRRERRHLVEAVADRLELPVGQAGVDEEAADRVRDRDQPRRARRERAVDVAERARAGSGRRCAASRRTARRVDARRDGTVDVRVHEVGVQQVGPDRAHACGRRRAPSADSRRAVQRTWSTGTPASLRARRRGARRRTPRRRGRRSAHRHRARAAPAAAGAGAAPRRRRPSPSAGGRPSSRRAGSGRGARRRRPCARGRSARACARRRRPISRAERRIGGELGEARRQRRTSPTGDEEALSPSSTTASVPPTRVATTGRPAASASIAATGVPSFAEVRQNASNAAYQSGSSFW